MGVNHSRAVLLNHHVQQALTSLQSQQSNAAHMQSFVSNASINSQNPIGISTNVLQNDQQLQLLNQFRAQQLLVSQKMNTSEKIREAQQHATKTHPSLSSKSHPNAAAASLIGNAASLSAPLESLLLQNVLLTNANGIDLTHLRYQPALSTSTPGLLAVSSTNGSMQTQAHELIKPIAMSANDVATNPQPNGTISPRPPIPVDPAPQSESLIERTIRLVEQNSLTAQQLNELQQQALLSLRQSVDSSSALQAAQISAAATAGQQSHDGLHTQQLTNLLTTAATRQSTSPAIHPFTPSPIRPTPTHPPTTTRDDIPPSHSLLAATEMHYNETFKKTQGLLHDSNDARSVPTISSHDHSSSKISTVESKSGDQDEQRSTTLHPQVMINLLNGVLSKVKNELHHQGVGVHLDATGRPIDFSARPVDPIFRRAREQLESSREYRDATSPSSHHINVDRTPRRPSFSLKEAEVVRLASERIQNTTAHPKANITSTETLTSSNGKVINVGKSSPPQTSTTSSDSNTFNKQESRTSMSPPKSIASPSTIATNTVVCADSEECRSKEEKTTERSNEKTVLDDYSSDYSPDEKRLRIALIEEE